MLPDDTSIIFRYFLPFSRIFNTLWNSSTPSTTAKKERVGRVWKCVCMMTCHSLLYDLINMLQKRYSVRKEAYQSNPAGLVSEFSDKIVPIQQIQ